MQGLGGLKQLKQNPLNIHYSRFDISPPLWRPPTKLPASACGEDVRLGQCSGMHLSERCRWAKARTPATEVSRLGEISDEEPFSVATRRVLETEPVEVVMRSALVRVISGSRAKGLMPAIVAVLAIAVAAPSAPAKLSSSFVGSFNTIKTVASTVPTNGDVNPYGVAVAPVSTGRLVKGDVLVSNFNDKGNLQGTGRTIVEISAVREGPPVRLANPKKLPGACPGGLGLTTALVALKSGWVIVGSLPTKDGSSATANSGCLIALNSSGTPVKTITGPLINGPWDMTALDHGNSADLFVTDVLNGTLTASPNRVDRGTVVRIDLRDLNRSIPTDRLRNDDRQGVRRANRPGRSRGRADGARAGRERHPLRRRQRVQPDRGDQRRGH